ncbi:hypothetical protein A5727_08330 [Mycobacterium sp. ACS4331]|nr:hypothetical protein A5727_08330 [Mycobacterium sp. ACS4331]
MSAPATMQSEARAMRRSRADDCALVTVRSDVEERRRYPTPPTTVPRAAMTMKRRGADDCAPPTMQSEARAMRRRGADD